MAVLYPQKDRGARGLRCLKNSATAALGVVRPRG
eukprot:CAMPEP_0198493292 /NCGR_PEP_ID=MMETSP1462-20131121/3929_1 /TAXON_ID=1333877 /ORGANISM="Brandtodinium nutriculum, Strain RCC3387" /LENGTH=33 /DNA_ID= /DNA_START= /DNA_END= /DNA_ORIENTATION=